MWTALLGLCSSTPLAAARAAIFTFRNGCCSPSCSGVFLRCGSVHVGRIVHRVVGLGRDHRRMRAQEHAMHEPVLVAPHRQVAQDRVRHEGGLALLGGEHRRREGVAAVGRLLETGPRLVDVVAALRQVVAARLQVRDPHRHVLGQRHADGEARQEAFVGLERRIVRIARARIDAGVGIAEQGRIEPGLARLARHVGEAVVERRAVAPRPVVHQIEPGMQAGARRAARRADRVVPLEQHAIGGEGIEMGRLHQRMADGAEALAAPLIDADMEDFADLLAHGNQIGKVAGAAIFNKPARVRNLSSGCHGCGSGNAAVSAQAWRHRT